jgi:hypothetical protein
MNSMGIIEGFKKLAFICMTMASLPVTALALPTVTLTLDDGSSSEADLNTGTFTVTRANDDNPGQALDVRVALTGNATIGADYSISPFNLFAQPNIYRVTIPANVTSTTVTLTPVLDSNEEEGDETAEFTLLGDGSTYTVGSPIFGIIIIADFTDLVFRDSFESP